MTIPNFNYIIEPISSQHNRDDFHCGIEALDYYLKKQAKQDVRRFLTAVFVLQDLEQQRIAGYYTLAATAIQLTDLPDFLIILDILILTNKITNSPPKIILKILKILIQTNKLNYK